ncbi:MAG: SAM-dependent methyltransferase [Pseudonocardiales bacterium]
MIPRMIMVPPGSYARIRLARTCAGRGEPLATIPSFYPLLRFGKRVEASRPEDGGVLPPFGSAPPVWSRWLQEPSHCQVGLLPSGSYLAISHPTAEVHGEAAEESVRHGNSSGAGPIRTRSRHELIGFFDRLDLLGPLSTL